MHPLDYNMRKLDAKIKLVKSIESAIETALNAISQAESDMEAQLDSLKRFKETESINPFGEPN